MATSSTQRKRGFAAMDPQRQREIASMGGKTSQQGGRGHSFNSDEARAAGRKGAAARAKKKKAVTQQGGA